MKSPSRPTTAPPLSKDFLNGQIQVDEIYVHPESFYLQHGVEVRLGTVARRVDVDAQGVELADGSWIPYDDLVFATGSTARTLSVPGAHSDSVLTLRTAADAENLRERLATTERLAVVGAGWIGTEVAAWASHNGTQVVLIDPNDVPLERVLGSEVGGRVGELHSIDGIELRMQTSIASFDLAPDGALRAVVTSDGEHIGCDLAVVAIGVRARDELAAAAGLATPNGIAVDDSLRASQSVFAVGDVSLHEHPLFGAIRVEHWSVARNHGQAVDAALVDGAPQPYAGIPYFMSRQHDTLLEYWGHAERWTDVIIRNGTQPGTLTALYLDDGRVLAGLSMGIGGAAEPICSLIERREAIDLDRVCDTNLTLTEAASTRPADEPVNLTQLASGEGTVATIGGQEIAICRTSSGELHTVRATCTHQGCTVGWNRAEGTWVCPCHGARFHPDGQVMRGPATTPLEVIEIIARAST